MLDHHEAPVGPDFALWVRSRRVAEMLTQEQLAERAGLSVRTVRNLETGRGGPPRLPTRRLVIAALTGSSPDLASRPASDPSDPSDPVDPQLGVAHEST